MMFRIRDLNQAWGLGVCACRLLRDPLDLTTQFQIVGKGAKNGCTDLYTYTPELLLTVPQLYIYLGKSLTTFSL